MNNKLNKKSSTNKPSKIETKEISISTFFNKKHFGAWLHNNRKSTRGRIKQYMPVGKDKMGNMHFKVIYS